ARSQLITRLSRDTNKIGRSGLAENSGFRSVRYVVFLHVSRYTPYKRPDYEKRFIVNPGRGNQHQASRFAIIAGETKQKNFLRTRSHRASRRVPPLGQLTPDREQSRLDSPASGRRGQGPLVAPQVLTAKIGRMSLSNHQLSRDYKNGIGFWS